MIIVRRVTLQRKSFVLLTVHFLFLQTISSKAEDIHFYAYGNEYAVEVLQHVLTYSPTKNYKVVPYRKVIPKDRAFSMMSKNQLIDVVFGGATIKRVTENQAIEIPILKGLNGWRIPVVSTKNKDLFKKLTSFDNFKKLKPGLFNRWSDAKIMKYNGIDVKTSSNYDGLWTMLAKNRFDYFPHSILIVDQEMTKYQHLDISLEPSSIIYYPTAYYFYVGKENNSLHKDINKGLKLAFDDGSLNDMFNQHYGDVVKSIRLQNRTVYSLTNPFLPPTTPVNNKRYWIELSSHK
jgi:hypothetical protein